MSSYHQKTYEIKKYIADVDKEWFQRYYNFITHLKDKKGFNPIQVAQNPNINIIQLLKDSELAEFLDVFVSNPRMSSQILESMREIEWNTSLLSPESHISISFILEKMGTHKFNWHTISSNKYINMRDINFYQNIPWDYKGVCYNPNLDIYNIKKFYHEGRHLDWIAISKHRKVLMCDIEENPDLPWVVDGISQNNNITTKFICSHPEMKWNYMLLSENSGLRLRFVFKNLDKPWSWTALSSHPRLSINIIKKYPNQGWNWYRISANPAFTIQTKKKNPQFPWSYKGFSCNPTLNMIYVIKHIDKNWDFDSLCYNRFTRDRNKFYQFKLREYFMAQKIIRFWKKQSTNLNCTIGRKLSSQRYDALQDEHDQMYIDEKEAQKILHENKVNTVRIGHKTELQFPQNIYS